MTVEQQNDKPVRNSRRTLQGVVMKDNRDKSIKVMVQELVKHRQYGKYIRRRTKLAVHDPRNEAQVGDKVEIVPCRRMSKSKSWRLVRVVNTAKLTKSERTLE